MYIFKKGSDIAQIEGDRVQLHISIYSKEVDGTYLIEIPSLDIHSYTVKEDEIENRIDDAIASFFRYWLKVEGKEKLIEHMLALGFNLSSSSIIPLNKTTSSKRKYKGIRTKRTLDEELVIS